MQEHEDEGLKNGNLEAVPGGEGFKQYENGQPEFSRENSYNQVPSDESVVSSGPGDTQIEQIVPASVDTQTETPEENKTEIPEERPETGLVESHSSAQPYPSAQPKPQVQPQFAPQSETMSETKSDGKKIVLTLVGAMMAIILVIVGVAVWNWAKWRLSEEENLPEAIYLGLQPGEENEKKEAMLTAYDEVGNEINDIAYQNDGLTFDSEGGDVYNYEVIEQNINNHLAKINDISKKNQSTTCSISRLSSIGDTEGAKRMVDDLNTENFSDTEWYCYYQAMRSYYMELNDQENMKKYTDLLQDILMETEEE